jgi:hypothetical protein
MYACGIVCITGLVYHYDISYSTNYMGCKNYIKVLK